MERHEIEYLMDFGRFMGKPIQGKLEETNISWVILTTEFAFKIKKNIKLSFLDYSTLALRKHFCEKELELNRRFSHIYLSVLPIRIKDGQFSISGEEGQIIEYTVCMLRLQSSKRMDAMLEQGKVNYRGIDLLAQQLATFHQKAEIIQTSFDIHQAKKIFNDLNTVQEIISLDPGYDRSWLVDDLINFSDYFLSRYSKNFQRRIDTGMIRDCHGDLHCGNIFMYRTPIIFDCIEFNDSFRHIDVLYEVAFLCMDLEFFGSKDLSDRLLMTYLHQFPCMTQGEDQRILLYFKVLRANVKAKVNLLNSRNEVDHDKRQTELAKGRKYLDLAFTYVNELNRLD
ncbi:hypothetical protein [Fontibacter flavus]|uniref:Aminoglycoside phosphotransferase domain-containing protein n=1 Tax=Fontibacter flavus TaxID=654838 RepID=A0ABV6FQG2_9BACT